MKKKGMRLFAVVMCALAGLIWSVRAVIDVVYQIYNESAFLLCLDILCAVIWIVAFVVQFWKYRLGREE